MAILAADAAQRRLATIHGWLLPTLTSAGLGYRTRFGGHLSLWSLVRLEDYGGAGFPDMNGDQLGVSWRTGGNYVGWAPLPPEAGGGIVYEVGRSRRVSMSIRHRARLLQLIDCVLSANRVARSTSIPTIRTSFTSIHGECDTSL